MIFLGLLRKMSSIKRVLKYPIVPLNQDSTIIFIQTAKIRLKIENKNI